MLMHFRDLREKLEPIAGGKAMSLSSPHAVDDYSFKFDATGLTEDGKPVVYQLIMTHDEFDRLARGIRAARRRFDDD